MSTLNEPKRVIDPGEKALRGFSHAPNWEDLTFTAEQHAYLVRLWRWHEASQRGPRHFDIVPYYVPPMGQRK